MKVRPYGKNSDYPPHKSSGVPEGLRVEFDLGCEGRLVANITTELVVIPSDDSIYGRYVKRIWWRERSARSSAPGMQSGSSSNMIPSERYVYKYDTRG